MYAAIKAEVSNRSRQLSDLWATRAMAQRTFVAVGVQVFCQFSGINGALAPDITFSERADLPKLLTISALKCTRA